MKNLHAIGLTAIIGVVASTAGVLNLRHERPAEGVSVAGLVSSAPASASSHVDERLRADLAAMEQYKPGYEFWRHVFTIPDGRIVFGSAVDGRRLEVTRMLRSDARESIASELERAHGPILHNETRGTFVSPGLARYGMFLAEWGSIYERFGVPAGVGLAQAMIESGFVGTRESEANAIGLCQWLEQNWDALDRMDPAVLEIENQTTQAPYCAAYISILATKYGSFIPALSAHHAGGTNVGRVLVNGERLGGDDTRERYFLGSEFALDLRHVSNGEYKDVYGSYGPRSYRYAEMIFGNISTITDAIASIPQRGMFAMRTPRALSLDDIVRRTGLPEQEVRRFNSALVKRVPAGATLYLPAYDSRFGPDVTFWKRPASLAFQALLSEFVSLQVPPETWDTPAFGTTLKSFERRFRATNTEEGSVMATVLAYVRGEASSARRRILAEFRSSDDIQDLFEQGVEALAD